MDYVVLSAIAMTTLCVCTFGMFAYLIRRQDREASMRTIFTGKKWMEECAVCLGAMLLGILVFCKGFPGTEKSYIRAMIDGLMTLWLISVGYIDLKEKIIPNALIGVGLLVWVVVLAMDVFIAGTSVKEALIYSLSGGLVVGGIMFVVAIVVKTALGMGDVKMFFLMGLLYGLNDTYTILLLSMFIMAAVSIVLLAMKKVTAKTAVPMAPFVAAGFLLSIFAGM